MHARTLADKRTYTTGDIADICDVWPRTVTKWIDKGILPAYRLPGGLDRRVRREHLIPFLRDHGMSLGRLARPVLLVGCEPLVAARLDELVREGGGANGVSLHAADSAFMAGLLAERVGPAVVIIDLALGRSQALEAARALRGSEAHTRAVLIALACEDKADLDGLAGHGFDDAFKKPFDVSLLAERVGLELEPRSETPALSRRGVPI